MHTQLETESSSVAVFHEMYVLHSTNRIGLFAASPAKHGWMAAAATVAVATVAATVAPAEAVAVAGGWDSRQLRVALPHPLFLQARAC